MLRNVAPLSNAATRTLYAALVRSILETNAVVWNPHEDKYILMVEQIQKRFLRYLYKNNYSYYPFLYPTRFLEGCLGYDSVELRRSLALAKFAINIIKNATDCTYLVSNIVRLCVPDGYMRVRRHNLLSVPTSRTNLYRNSPVARALRLLSSLLADAPHCDLFADKIESLMNECKKYLENRMYLKYS